MCTSSPYFVDTLLLTAIAPLALQRTGQRPDYLSSRCVTLPASPPPSRIRSGSNPRHAPPPHNVRRFRLADDFLSDRKTSRPVAMGCSAGTTNGCKGDMGAVGAVSAVGAVGAVGVVDGAADAAAAADAGAATDAAADASPQRDSGAGARWASGARVDTLDWALLLEAAFAVYRDLGDGCSERTYQKKLYYDMYCRDIPCIIERPVHTTTHHGMTLGKGRVDLEVARRFVLELKVTRATEKNVRNDKRQLLRYLTAYQEQKLHIERAAIVYFSNNEVRVVEVSTAPRARNTFVPRKAAAGGSA